MLEWTRSTALSSRAVALAAALSVTFAPVNALAIPQGGVVSAGQASIVSSGNQLTVNQTSGKAIIDWSSFNVAPNEAVTFNQPSSSSITLNRVNDINPSSIQGQITANGTVVLVNPNGVFFGPNSKVDVSGLIATSADIANSDFMAGNMNFSKPGNPNASIVNQGTITAADAGLVGLVAPSVENSGVINARLGKATLASGDTFTLDLAGDQLISVAVSADQLPKQAVSNSGTIQADGGTVTMTAAAARKVVNSLVSNSGTIQANRFGTVNGRIVLYAEGSNAVAGNVAANKGKKSGTSLAQNSGTISASGKNSGESGGSISVLADNVNLLSGSLLDVSGDIGGGTIQVGGDFHGAGTTSTAITTYVDANARIFADAITSGDGGNVTVWADDNTAFAGSITARGGALSGNGGYVETSGHQYLAYTGTVVANAPHGQAGTLLLDPEDITISAAANTDETGSPNFVPGNTQATSVIQNSTINTLLNGGTSVSITTSSNAQSGPNGGSITVNAALTAGGAGNASLTLSSYNNITINSSDTITLNGTGVLTLTANTGGGGGTITTNAALTTSTGAVNLSGYGVSGSSAGTITTSNGPVNITTTGSGSGTLAGAITAGSGLITFTIADSTTASGALSNSAGVTKSGSGTLTLSNAGNTYTGGTNINAGILNFVSGALGTTGNITFGGGTLQYAAGNTQDISARLKNSTSGAITINTVNNNVTYASIIDTSNTAGLTVNSTGTGILTLSGANSFTGATTITAGTISIASDTNFGTVPGSATPGSIVLNGGTLGITSTMTLNANRGIALNGNGTISVANNRSATYNGIIAGTGSLSFTSPSGSIAFGGNNSFTGGLYILSGTVLGSVANAFGASIANGLGTGIVTLGNSAGGTANASLLANFSGTATYANPIVLASNTTGILTIGNGTANSCNGTFTGGVTGYNSFVINNGSGNRTLTFASVNGSTINNTGTITHASIAGVLSPTLISAPIGPNVTGIIENATNTGETLSITGLITVGSNGLTLTNSNGSGSNLLAISGGIAGTGNVVLNNSSLIGNGITISGTSVNNTGTITNLNSSSSVLISAAVGSNVTGLIQNSSGAGLLQLSNASNAQQATTVTLGTLQTTAANVLGSGALTVNGTLDLNGFSQSVGALLGGGTITSTAAGTIGLTTNSSTNTTFSGTYLKGTATSDSLTKQGSGTLTLSGANTFNGGTTISAGTLQIANATALGANGGAVSVTSGAVLDLNGTTMTNTNALTLNGTGIASGGALINSSASAGTYAGLITLGSTSSIVAGTGNITISNAGTITGSGFGLTVGGSANTSIASLIGTGAGTLTKSGTGTLTLSNAGNTYTGTTNINGGPLNFVSGSLGTTGNITFGGGTLQYAAGNTQDISSRLKNSTTGAITIDAVNNNVTFGSVIDSSNTNGLTLNSTGTGILTLSGANTYSGATTVTAGTLKTGAANVLGGASSNSALVMNGGTLDLNGWNEAVGSITGSSNITSNAAGSITLTAGYDNTSPAAYSGVISNGSGTISLTKVGTGTLTLSGPNTYTGATTVNAGTLKLGAANAVGSSSAITVGASGTFNLNNFNDTVASIADNGTVAFGTGNTLTTSGNQTYNNGTVTGSGIGMTITGSGALTLGATAWAGSVTLSTNSGMMEFAGAQTLGTNSLTAVSTSGNIQLDAGATITSTASSGNSIILAAGGNFINNSGAGASTLAAGSGSAHWLVYSTTAGWDVNGASTLNPTTTLNSTTYPTTTGANGNTWFYSTSGVVNLGTITITAKDQTVTYGTAPSTTAVLNTTYSCTYSGSACSAGILADISGVPGLSISGVTTSVSGNYNASTWTGAILAANGSLGFQTGYTGSFSFSPGTLTVNPLAVTLSGARSYDSTANAVSGILNITNVQGSDAINLASGTATVAGINHGAQLITSMGTLALGNNAAGNYTLTGASGSVTINPLAVTLSGARNYDSTANAVSGILSITNVQGSDTINLASGAATLAGINHGAEAITSAGTLALGNNAAGNYTLTGLSGSVTINPLAVTLSGVRSYDSTANAAFGILTVSNFQGSDTINLASGTATLAGINHGAEAITSMGTLALGNNAAGNYTLAGASGSVTINPLAVTLSGARSYDSTNNAVFGILSITDVQGSDTINLSSGTATLAGINHGAEAITGVGTLALGNNAAGNYTLAGASGSVTINPLAVTLSGVRSYDSTANAGFGILSITDVQGSDTISLASGTATLAGINHGAEAITSAGTLALGNNAAGNYTLTGLSGSVTINPLAVTLSGVRSYDSTNNAAFGILTVSNFQGSDTINLASGTGTLAGINHGAEAITSMGTLALGNNAAGNYTLAGASGSVTINPLAVTLSGVRSYDSTANAVSGILNITNVQGSDTINLASGTATLAGINHGAEAITSAGTLALGNNAAGNYTLTGLSGSVTINPLAVTLSGVRSYDSTANAAFGILTVSNFQGSDTINLASGTATLAGINHGAEAITSMGTLALGNNAAGNYTLAGASGSVTINPLAVTLSGARSYDSTNNAVFGILSITDVQGSDTINLSSGTATLAGINHGAEAITGVGTLALGNNAAGNYTLAGASGSVTINSLAVTLSGTRSYDSTSTAASGILSITDVQGSDMISLASGSVNLASANQGSVAITNAGTLALANNAAGNYTLTGLSGTVTINPLAVTLSGTRSYDSTSTAASGILSITDVQGSDTISLASGSVNLASANHGLVAITSAGTLTLGNNAAGNYTLTGYSGSVTISPLAVMLSGARSYDSTANAVSGILSITNVQGSDTINLASGTATLAGINHGAEAITNAGTLTLGNNAAGNYTLTGLSGSVTINPLAVTLSGTRSYDSTANAVSGILSITNVQGSDTINLASGTATLAGINHGAEAITNSGTLALGNNAAGNYTLTGLAGSVTINPLAVTLSGVRSYDSTANAAFGILTVSNFQGSDTINLASGTATLAGINHGAEAITSLGTLALGNNAAGNYTLTGASGSVTINPLAVTLSGSRTYDSTNNAAFGILNITNVQGSDTINLASGAATLAGINHGAEAITSAGTLALGNNAAGNYTLTGLSGSVTINPLAVTLSGSRSYDSTNTAASGILTVSNKYAGDTVNVTGTPATLAGVNAGSQAIADVSGLSLSNNNYTLTGYSGSVTINPLAVVLSGSKTYDGTPNAAFGSLSIANVQGSDTVTLASGTGTLAGANAGAEAITSIGNLTLGTNAAGNYTLVGFSGSMTITPAHLTVKAVDNNTMTYGDNSLPGLTYTITGYVNGEGSGVISGAPSITTNATAYNGTAGSGSNAGTYAITPAQGSLAAANYDFSFSNGVLTVNKAVLTATANDQTRPIGAANPSFTETVTGFTNGDTSAIVSGSATGSSTATQASPVSTYAIIGSTTGLSLASGNNYTFAAANGTLTVSSAVGGVITFTANNLFRLYGGFTPTLTYAFSCSNGCLENLAVTGAPALSTPTTASTGVGTASINIGQGSLALASGYGLYQINYVPGTLTINPATLTVTANDQSRRYGASNPTFTESISGFVNGDTSDVISGIPTGISETNNTSAPGTYTIFGSVAGLSQPGGNNYVFTTKNGLLTIQPQPPLPPTVVAAIDQQALQPVFRSNISNSTLNFTSSTLASNVTTNNTLNINNINFDADQRKKSLLSPIHLQNNAEDNKPIPSDEQFLNPLAGPSTNPANIWWDGRLLHFRKSRNGL